MTRYGYERLSFATFNAGVLAARAEYDRLVHCHRCGDFVRLSHPMPAPSTAPRYCDSCKRLPTRRKR